MEGKGAFERLSLNSIARCQGGLSLRNVLPPWTTTVIKYEQNFQFLWILLSWHHTEFFLSSFSYSFPLSIFVLLLYANFHTCIHVLSLSRWEREQNVYQIWSIYLSNFDTHSVLIPCLSSSQIYVLYYLIYPLNPFSTAYIMMGVGPSSRVWMISLEV